MAKWFGFTLPFMQIIVDFIKDYLIYKQPVLSVANDTPLLHLLFVSSNANKNKTIMDEDLDTF